MRTIKKRLIFNRENDILVVDEGNDFNAVFDMNSIAGTLSFTLPYVKTENPEQITLGIQNLKKFDFVWLYYAELDSDREPTLKEWNLIFRGYIETIRFSKSKDNYKYEILCNSLLGLAAYNSLYIAAQASNMVDMPALILQRANMQMGVNNNVQQNNPDDARDLITEDMLDVQLNNDFANIIASSINVKTAKEAIEEFRDKYGLIFTENMDGVVQVTTLTNYISNASNYEFKVAAPEKELEQDNLNLTLSQEAMLSIGKVVSGHIEYNQKIGKNVIKFAENWWSGFKYASVKVLDFFKKTYVNPWLKIIGQAVPKWSQDLQTLSGITFNGVYNNLVNNAEFKKRIKLRDDEKDNININNVLYFDINKNIFEIQYPDITTNYDGVIVEGIGCVGKAIDLSAIILKNIPETFGYYNINILKLYRRDVYDVYTLNKIARQKLYDIKQEHSVIIKTMFNPKFRIGMPFVVNDNDRYHGKEIFFISRIAYMISKSEVYCNITGISSLLNVLPERIVVDNIFVNDVNQLGIEDKIANDAWQNF